MFVEEYRQLKQEQLARISSRDNLIYVTLASLAAVIVATLQVGLPEMLLFLSPVCLVLGWTHLVNDQKVSAIGRHIRVNLVPKIETALGANTFLFTWETEHRVDSRRLVRKIGQLAIDLLTFCVPAIVAIAAYWFVGRQTILFGVVSLIELVATLLLAWAIIDIADFGHSREGSRHMPAAKDAK